MPTRWERLAASMQNKGLEAAWITARENMRYLTGYTGEGALFVSPDGCVILTDFRYIEQAERQSPGTRVERTTAETKMPQLLNMLLREKGIGKLAYEPDALTVQQFDDARAALDGVELVPLGGLPEQLRAIKDAGEIECIIRASNIACKAFEALLPRVKPGMTEREVQLELDYQMLRMGSEAVAFETIACAGPNGSLPHATPSDRPIQTGELMTLDFGAQIDGYKCDMTRTVAIGDISKQLMDIYDTVLLAQTEAFKAIRPGAICRDVDKVARDIIEPKYPGAFGHSLGHSVGLFIHENPSFSVRCDAALVPGHVMTVEPGIYVPGVGGCRIEDMAILTEVGYINPITAKKTLIVV